ncbi:MULTISPECIES: S9 family peptidase [unclassified Anaeromyxobacter]|uniref:S9 family peptidase n=1 Tax=unclassified Anaeromyxobacter TaxID=2620896 RepID=UPI001F57B9D6|nr:MULTISPECIES: S9 family peptidase [unclassified Anaeromyxobacter]
MLTSALAALVVATAAPRPFTVDDLVALPRVGAPELSPDGARVAFTVGRLDRAGDKISSALYVVPAAGGVRRQLTDRDERISSPRFSPDGKRLAFVSTRGGTPQAHVVDLASGEIRPVSDLPGGVSELLWAPDGASLLVTADVDPRCGADAACAARAEAEAKGKPRLATRLLFRHWNEWRERLRTHVLRVPLDGGAPADLTPGDRDAPPAVRGGVDDLAVSPDGKTLYFTSVADPLEAASTNADVFAVPLAGGEARRVTSGPGWDASPRPSPDGNRIAWLSQARGGYESDRFRVMVAGTDGKDARDLTAGTELSASDLHWARGGAALRFAALTSGYHELYEVDVRSGKIAKLAGTPALGGRPRVNVQSVSYSADGTRAAALVDGISAPPEVAVLEGAPGKARWAERTRLAADALAGVARPMLRPLEAISKDGTKVFGWIVLPAGHRDGERHPAAVLVHGGPQGAWNDAWTSRWNAMLYAARGYAVVLPNPRGSTGYGQAYVDAVSRDWGGKPYEDLMALVDAAIALGTVDGERMCAAGASYGGYMVHWLNGQTDRFRCLVSHAGIFDLEAFFYRTEELWFPEWEFGGTPFEQPGDYQKFSPSRFVQRWHTPTLVSVGELDYRTGVDQGYAAFTALQRRGIPSKLLAFPDEGHWVSKPKNARVFYDVVLGWLDEHIGPAANLSAKAR